MKQFGLQGRINDIDMDDLALTANKGKSVVTHDGSKLKNALNAKLN